MIRQCFFSLLLFTGFEVKQGGGESNLDETERSGNGGMKRRERWKEASVKKKSLRRINDGSGGEGKHERKRNEVIKGGINSDVMDSTGERQRRRIVCLKKILKCLKVIGTNE